MSDTSQYGNRPAAAPTPAASPTPTGDAPVAQVVLLDPQGQPARAVALTSAGLTIGRLPGSGMELEATTVSRNHARVDWDGRQAWVTDLGARGGTQLGAARLVPQQPQLWKPGQTLQVGPYSLQVEIATPPAPAPPLSIHQAPTTPIAAPAVAAAPLQRIAVALAPGQQYLELTPGQIAVASVTIANQGGFADSLLVTVAGLPAHWVAAPAQPLALAAGGRAVVPINIRVPEEPESLAGEYPVTLHARSVEYPAEAGLAHARWQVLPYAAGQLELAPTRAHASEHAVYSVRVTNLGNAPAIYDLSAEDDEQVLACSFLQSQLEVAPGQFVDTPLTVQAERRLYGRPRRYGISVRAAGEANTLTAEGQFIHEAVLPIWSLPMAAALLALVLLCGLLPPATFGTALTGVPIGFLRATTTATPGSTAVAVDLSATDAAIQIVTQTAIQAAKETAVGAPLGTQQALETSIAQVTAAAAQTAAANATASVVAQAVADAATSAAAQSAADATTAAAQSAADATTAAAQSTANAAGTATAGAQQTAAVPRATPTAKPTNAPTTTPAVAAQLVFAVPPGNSTAGEVFPQQPVIRVLDANGNLATNFTDEVTLSIANNSGGSTLGGTVTVNAVGGIATFADLSMDKAGTGYTLAASGGGFISDDSATFTITPGRATKLVFVTSPDNTKAGVPFTNQPIIRALDGFDNIDTNFRSTVSLGIKSGTGTAGASLGGGKNILAVDGIANFASKDLSIDYVGQNYQLTATGGGLSSNSLLFNILASNLVFRRSPVATKANTAFVQQPRVQAEDAAGHVDTTFQGTITLSIKPNSGTANATLGGTPSTTASQGMADFAGKGLNINRVGQDYHLIASAANLTSGESDSFDITADRLLFNPSPSTTTTAGDAFDTQPIVQAVDGFGTIDTTFTGSISVAIKSGTSTPGATLEPPTNLTKDAVNGEARFRDLKINKAHDGYRLTATSTGLTPADSDAFNIIAGQATQLIFSTSPSASTGGEAFPTQPVVQAVDGFGNRDINFTSAVALTITPSTNTTGAILGPPDKITMNAVNGVAAFSGLSIDKTKTGSGYTLQATSGTLTSLPSNAFIINIGSADHLEIQQSVSSQSSGQQFNIIVVVTDKGHNIVQNYTGGGNFQLELVNSGGNSGTLMVNGSTPAPIPLNGSSVQVLVTVTLAPPQGGTPIPPGTFRLKPISTWPGSLRDQPSNEFTVR